MSNPKGFAKHETELEQMVLGHPRGSRTTHAFLPNEQSTVALKNWDILFKALVLCSLTLKIYKHKGKENESSKVKIICIGEPSFKNTAVAPPGNHKHMT